MFSHHAVLNQSTQEEVTFLVISAGVTVATGLIVAAGHFHAALDFHSRVVSWALDVAANVARAISTVTA